MRTRRSTALSSFAVGGSAPAVALALLLSLVGLPAGAEVLVQGEQFRVNPNPAGNQTQPDVAVDAAGNMLGLIVLHFDDGRDMVIHAVPMRRQYQHLLPPEERNLT